MRRLSSKACIQSLECCARLLGRQTSARHHGILRVDPRRESVMKEYTLQATLLASIRVKAKTSAEAEQKLRTALAVSDANLGMLDDTPIVVPVEIEGDLDLIETKESTGGNVDGELAMTQGGLRPTPFRWKL